MKSMVCTSVEATVDEIMRVNADVVMIGEAAHGELVSWPLRLAVVRRWITDGHRVLIMCETLDAYVKPMNTARGCPIVYDDGFFHPSLMPFAVFSREHMNIMHEFWMMRSSCRFVGIDVQALDFPKIRGTSREIRDIHARHKAAWDRAKDNTTFRGTERNRINAATIRSLCDNDATTKKVYFAHNEHVSKDCSESRRNPAYFTEGAIFSRSNGVSVLSVATWARNMCHTWGTPDVSCEKSEHMSDNRKTDFDVVFVRSTDEDAKETFTPLKNIMAVQTRSQL